MILLFPHCNAGEKQREGTKMENREPRVFNEKRERRRKGTTVTERRSEKTGERNRFLSGDSRATGS